MSQNVWSKVCILKISPWSPILPSFGNIIFNMSITWKWEPQFGVRKNCITNGEVSLSKATNDRHADTRKQYINVSKTIYFLNKKFPARKELFIFYSDLESFATFSIDDSFHICGSADQGMPFANYLLGVRAGEHHHVVTHALFAPQRNCENRSIWRACSTRGRDVIWWKHPLFSLWTPGTLSSTMMNDSWKHSQTRRGASIVNMPLQFVSL